MTNEVIKYYSDYLKRVMTHRKDLNLKSGEVGRDILLEDETKEEFVERYLQTLGLLGLSLYKEDDLVFEKDLRFDTLEEYYTIKLSPQLQERIRKELM